MEPDDPLEPALEWTQGSVMMQKQTSLERNYVLVMKEPSFHGHIPRNF